MRCPLLVGLVLVLAGCATPAPARSATPTEAVPRFPAVSGQVLEQTPLARDDWRIRVRVADADQAYADARHRLTATGFILTKDRVGHGGGDGQACTPTLCVSFGAVEGDGGPVLTYEVFRGGGITD